MSETPGGITGPKPSCGTAALGAGSPGTTACSVSPGSGADVASTPSDDLPPPTGLQARLHATLGIDLRSLALFRVGMAAMILCDLFERSRSLRAHYTDQGVLPRAQLLRFFSDESFFSLHLAFGSTFGISLLFLLAAGAAVALAIGWRTRLMTFVSWLLLVSIDVRNPQVVQAADLLMRVMLFWSLFLPLGARWSVDGASDPPPSPGRKTVLSMGSVAILLQLFMVYAFGAMHKFNPFWLADGDAVRRALAIDMYVTPLGQWLRGHPALLPFLTRATIAFEAFGFLLALCPVWTGPLRTLAVFLFLGFHLSLRLFIEVGHFSYVAAICWMLVLPTGFWDALLARLSTPARRGLRVYYDGECAFCRRGALILRTFLLLPGTPLRPAQEEPVIEALMRANNSWVVVDARDQPHLKFDACTTIVAHSPLAWPLAPLLRLPPIAGIGLRLYESVANDRGRANRWTAWLHPRPVRLGAGAPAAALIAALLLFVVAWNVRTLDFKRFAAWFPERWNPIGFAFRVDQCWDMFAPMPMTGDGWFIADARLADGRRLDLWSGKEVAFDKPADVAGSYRDQRWRKYLEHVSIDSYPEEAADFAAWLVRDWNERHAAEERVRVLAIYFVREMVTDKGKDPPERMLKYRYRAEE
ncbi:MAG: HTTM domain-containing protein [Planctomycetota bacterium]|nr:HTTM domain-containing protein [Planctomycetota bacterium]